jgi:hypothetical protein
MTVKPQSLRFISLASIFLSCGLSSGPYLLSQTPTQIGDFWQRSPNKGGTEWNTAANSWRLTPFDPKSQIDTVSPSVREQRNSYWKPILDGQYKTFIASASHPRPSEGSVDITRPELSGDAGSIWVIATFEKFRVIAIDPEYHLIYTERDFRLDTVIRAPDSLHLSAGMLITSDLPGGRIKTPQGDTVSSLPPISPRQYDLRRGRKYLLKLLHGDQADLFSVVKQWDLSSGTVQPNDLGEMDRVARGESAIKGMSENDLINYLQSVLPAEPKK